MTNTLAHTESRFELEQNDANYPELLLHREASPRVIYGLGQEDALQAGVAIIGARNATTYGTSIAKRVAGWAADLGLVVYSGGARGCDQAAHWGALEAGGKTVAVMACGADIVYPSRAENLLQRVADTGAVISEYAWQMPPMKYRFRERNRLIAALSNLVIVVEARLPSGTLSTVHHALDLGVPVAAVPGSILCLESAAPNRLIGEGAFPICCREDLAFACSLSSSRPNLAKLYEGFESAAAKKKIKQSKEVQSSFDFEPELESHAGKIYESLQSMPSLPDELAQNLNLSVGEVLETLGNFEVQGLVTRASDGRYGIGTSSC